MPIEVVKTPLVSTDFLELLDKTFTKEAAMWKPGMTEAELANKAGERYVVEWIINHVRTSTKA